MGKSEKQLKNLELKFYLSLERYYQKAFENEFGFPFPVDAVYAYVFEGSQTVYVLKNGDYMINAADGTEHTYKTLCDAKNELWKEVKNLELL